MTLRNLQSDFGCCNIDFFPLSVSLLSCIYGHKNIIVNLTIIFPLKMREIEMTYSQPSLRPYPKRCVPVKNKRMKELKSSKKIEFSDLLYCRNVLIAFPFAVIWTRYYKFKRLQRIYLLHMDRMETYSYLISICFVLPPEPIKNFRSFQIEQQKILFKSVVLFFIFICVFCLLKYLSKCLVNLA